MESKWAGTVDDAFFNGDAFDKNRKIQKPELQFSERASKSAYYVIGLDIGRKGCDSVAVVVKVTPQSVGQSIKQVVNIVPMTDMHFEDQTKIIKSLYFKYKARMIAIDGNGIGIAVLDYLVKPQIDYENNETYPPFGIANDEEGFYKKYQTSDTIFDAVFVIKANASLNTEMYANLKDSINSGKVKFLIDEKTAQGKLLDTSMGQKMSPIARQEYLMPYKLTSILKEELLNLREETDGTINIILKRVSKKVGKDKVSALGYALYYIKKSEEAKKKRRRNISDYIFMN